MQTTIYISKENMLFDSIDKFKSLKFTNSKELTVLYENEYDDEYFYEYDNEYNDEYDDEIEYEYLKNKKNHIYEWLMAVVKEILQSEAFKSVPNGDYLTFNDQKAFKNKEILNFTGKLIALAINNNYKLDLNLSLFIWKYLLSQPFTIEDMKEYDQSIYQSLKLSSENDMKEMDKLKILNKIFLGNNEKIYESMLDGFNEMIDYTKLKKMKAETLRNIVV